MLPSAYSLPPVPSTLLRLAEDVSALVERGKVLDHLLQDHLPGVVALDRLIHVVLLVDRVDCDQLVLYADVGFENGLGISGEWRRE